jgi:DNA replication and repair protein RecF
LRITQIKLTNIRNFSELVWHPGKKLNFLVGENGQGKTSVLEAIHFISDLRSFRNAKAEEIQQWRKSFSEIEVEIADQDWKTVLRIVFEKSESIPPRVQKTVSINGKILRSSTEYLKARTRSYGMGFHTIAFNPSDHELIRGEPALRRAYLNQSMSAWSASYIDLLKDYQRALEQRNKTLKDWDFRPSHELLESFTEQCIDKGSEIVWMRLKYLHELAPLLRRYISHVAPLQPDISICYYSGFLVDSNVHFTGQQGVLSLETIKTEFTQKIIQLGPQERRSKTTLVGPHRDDWGMFLGPEPLKGFGSQGETRSALLALKLSESELYMTETGMKPVFVLDDFSSELDKNRRLLLLNYLRTAETQVFVTTTEESLFATAGESQSRLGKTVRVSQGKLMEIE